MLFSAHARTAQALRITQRTPRCGAPCCRRQPSGASGRRAAMRAPPRGYAQRASPRRDAAPCAPARTQRAAPCDATPRRRRADFCDAPLPFCLIRACQRDARSAPLMFAVASARARRCCAMPDVRCHARQPRDDAARRRAPPSDGRSDSAAIPPPPPRRSAAYAAPCVAPARRAAPCLLHAASFAAMFYCRSQAMLCRHTRGGRYIGAATACVSA